MAFCSAGVGFGTEGAVGGLGASCLAQVGIGRRRKRRLDSTKERNESQSALGK